jgi:hypothetical protein
MIEEACFLNKTLEVSVSICVGCPHIPAVFFHSSDRHQKGPCMLVLLIVKGRLVLTLLCFCEGHVMSAECKLK